ncbi:DUF5020 family protein [Marinobacterium jannaschii]|uniref:DUF5020 family protein n=1 Tax=Marinobacterium jannaschii TaxID=64970 RepID=UPI0004883E30|nr:DUF5020 family protein [Marinobacterium jannaschii]
MHLKKSALCVLAGLGITAQAQAEMFWNDFSISYLNGDNYEVGDPEREVITFEHASGHSWGDTFLFVDRLKSDNGDTETYFEFSPRLSIGNLSGSDLSFGPVKDVFLATTWESGENFDNILYGIGFSFDAPGFNYLDANIYHASNENGEDDEQLTLTWGLPFNIAGGEFLYDGFLDWSTAKTGGSSEMNFTSQLKWNVAKALGHDARFYVGLEYAYWNNKFGITDIDERNPSLLVKWHF